MKKILAITAVSAIALFMTAQTASAHRPHGGIVVVTNDNNTTVINTVSAIANAGGNEANGGSAEGTRGDINGGKGGTIFVGSVYATAFAENTVNTNNTRVVSTYSRCGKGKVIVHNNNNTTVKNPVSATVNAGGNEANGGDAEGDGCGRRHGGNEVNGGKGGDITVYEIESYADAVNVVRTNVTRIIRR